MALLMSALVHDSRSTATSTMSASGALPLYAPDLYGSEPVAMPATCVPCEFSELSPMALAISSGVSSSMP